MGLALGPHNPITPRRMADAEGPSPKWTIRAEKNVPLAGLRGQRTCEVCEWDESLSLILVNNSCAKVRHQNGSPLGFPV